MASNRFFVEDFDFDGKIQIISDKEIVRQVARVLRLKKGDEVIFFRGDYREAKAEIIEIGKGGLKVLLKSVGENINEPEKEAILYQSLLKKDNFELVCQKAVEAGIKKIIPIISSRTVKQNINIKRIEKIIKEAAEQSGRAMLPELANPARLEEAVKNTNCDTNLFFDSSGRIVNLRNWEAGKKMTGVWIGPEGGWTSEEIHLAKSNNFEIISLGKLTLRAETAAIIGSYLSLKI